MKEITKIMVNDFKIMKLGYDFLGYKVNRKKDLSYHHLIIPRRHCKGAGLGEGYLYWNGAILRQNTSHNYLHIIENIDPEIFCLITSEMIDENIKRKIDIDNLKRIKDLLIYFEKEHDHDITKSGKLLIKREFVTSRVKL
jgi:hypothetical protein|nr:MAG TPA: hypothetical protein [Caudoviricetes sp.]